MDGPTTSKLQSSTASVLGLTCSSSDTGYPTPSSLDRVQGIGRSPGSTSSVISDSRGSPFSAKWKGPWFERLHEMMLSTEYGRPKMEES